MSTILSYNFWNGFSCCQFALLMMMRNANDAGKSTKAWPHIGNKLTERSLIVKVALGGDEGGGWAQEAGAVTHPGSKTLLAITTSSYLGIATSPRSCLLHCTTVLHRNQLLKNLADSVFQFATASCELEPSLGLSGQIWKCRLADNWTAGLPIVNCGNWQLSSSLSVSFSSFSSLRSSQRRKKQPE